MPQHGTPDTQGDPLDPQQDTPDATPAQEQDTPDATPAHEEDTPDAATGPQHG